MKGIIEEIIARLRRDKLGFGQRPCSRYDQAKAQYFIDYVLGYEPVNDLLQQAPVEAMADLSETQQKQLKVMVDRMDRYGALVGGWQTCRCPKGRSCRCVPADCLADLDERLTFWVRRNLPNNYQQYTTQVVAALRAALRTEIGNYRFQADLLAWAIPMLVETLWQQLEQVTKQSGSRVDVAHLRQKLRPVAQHILDHIRATYGIDGIDAADVVDRALLLVIGVTADEYDNNQAKGDVEVFEWALLKLKSQFKLHTLFYLEPNLSHKWGLSQDKDGWEWQKRRRLFEVFCDLAP